MTPVFRCAGVAVGRLARCSPARSFIWPSCLPAAMNWSFSIKLRDPARTRSLSRASICSRCRSISCGSSLRTGSNPVTFSGGRVEGGGGPEGDAEAPFCGSARTTSSPLAAGSGGTCPVACPPRSAGPPCPSVPSFGLGAFGLGIGGLVASTSG